MPKFIFAYHGGKMPDTPEEGAEMMARWSAWFEGMGQAVIDGGNPVGPSTTVTKDSVVDNGGSNPISGYSLIEATDMAAAVEIAKGCPILDHGTVEVAETFDI